jgi:hypothetical protein
MEFSFIKTDYMINETKLYKTVVDYEKLFLDLDEDTVESLTTLTTYLYTYFNATIKYSNNSTINIDCVKKIDNIPVKLYFYIIKNYKDYTTNTEINKLGFNISIPSSDHINKLDYDILQNFFLLNININDETIFKNYIYNICFYCYIVMRDFKYHPMLTYLNHYEDIKELVIIKSALVNLFGEKHDCSVCYEQTILKTECNHALCQKCFSSLEQKTCPICRNELVDENTFSYQEIDIFLH